MPAVGGGVAAPASGDGVPVLLATRGAAKGLWGHALVALAGDGGLGSDRLPIAPGSVIFGDRGARDLHVDSVGVLGADDDFRTRASLGVAVDAWRSARVSVTQSIPSRGSASLD